MMAHQGMKVLLALVLGFVAIGVGVTVSPKALAGSQPQQPNYVQCSRLGNTITHYGSTQYPGNGDQAVPQIQVWFDSVYAGLICQEQAGVNWTTSHCSSRTIDVYFTNGLGGDKYTNMNCGTILYKSNFTYSEGGCTFYMSARTSDSYQISWNSRFC